MHRGRLAALDRPQALKAATGKPAATLADAFAHLTGDALSEEGSLADVRRARRTAHRLG